MNQEIKPPLIEQFFDAIIDSLILIAPIIGGGAFFKEPSAGNTIFFLILLCVWKISYQRV